MWDFLPIFGNKYRYSVLLSKCYVIDYTSKRVIIENAQALDAWYEMHVTWPTDEKE